MIFSQFCVTKTPRFVPCDAMLDFLIIFQHELHHFYAKLSTHLNIFIILNNSSLTNIQNKIYISIISVKIHQIHQPHSLPSSALTMASGHVTIPRIRAAIYKISGGDVMRDFPLVQSRNSILPNSNNKFYIRNVDSICLRSTQVWIRYLLAAICRKYPRFRSILRKITNVNDM